MSDELVSISDFLDWLEERASVYATWANEAVCEAADHTGCGESHQFDNRCLEAIGWCSLRAI